MRSLRRRLILLLFFMVLSSIIFGALITSATLLLGERAQQAWRDKLLADHLAQAVQMHESQLKALESSVVSGEPASQASLNAMKTDMGESLRRWKEIAKTEREIGEHKMAELRFVSFWSGWKQVFRLIDAGRRADAFEVMNAVVKPEAEGLSKDLRSLYMDKRARSMQLGDPVKAMTGRLTLFSAAAGLAGLLMTMSLALAVFLLFSNFFKAVRGKALLLSRGEPVLPPEEGCSIEESEIGGYLNQASGLKESTSLQMAESARRAAVGNLSGVLAEEVQKRVLRIIENAHLLLGHMPSDDPNRALARDVERAASRCGNVLRPLLDFTELSTYEFQPVEADALLASVLHLYEKQLASANVEFEWTKDPSLPNVWGSPVHLEQVFSHLIQNALDAAREGGKFSIAAEHVSLDERHYVDVVFTDNGSGIDPEVFPNIFEPFFSTKNVLEHSGLGLPVSMAIVRQHRGEIFARSAGSDQGAVFVVRLPADPSQFL